MKIAIASGKGGTGKTTIATNLAYTIFRMGRGIQYLDCDVEEPNGHIFLRPEVEVTEKATVGVPQVDTEKCNGCATCVESCPSEALSLEEEKIKVDDSACIDCGVCVDECPTEALTLE